MNEPDLPLVPPLPPMLARLVRELPRDEGLVFEPKWDGFRCLAFRRGEEVDLRSRNQRALGRYFPELVDALLALDSRRFVLDGEIIVTKDSHFDFTALLQRLHPAASRVERLRRESPACFVAFDLLAQDDASLLRHRFADRRKRLEELLAEGPDRVVATAATDDPDLAEKWLHELHGNGVDGLIAKHRDMPYVPGKRAMLKVKRERTVDCVVGGFRWHHSEPTVGSLLLGLYAGPTLQHVGLASSFTAARRSELVEEIRPYLTDLAGHPWERGFNLTEGPVGRLPGAASRFAYGREITWVPLRPVLVAEVGYEHLEGDRFRHPARFRHWRPDRDPRSCTYEQFEVSGNLDLSRLLT